MSELSSRTIAIIGARGSGKSHFMALLINRINALAVEFDWTLSWLTEETNRRYKDEFYNPLFLANVPLRYTQVSEPPPLLYSLNIRKRQKKITLTFFDTAGESLEEDKIKDIAKYICKSSGIICLLDPLQMRPVRAELKEHCGKKEEELPAMYDNHDTGIILNRVGNLISNYYHDNGLSLPKGKIPIPLAVTFSKFDMMERPTNNDSPMLFGRDSVLYGQSAHRGHYNKTEGKSIHGDLSNWLTEADEFHTIIPQSNRFAHHQFFGFSALGDNPQATQKLKGKPKPWRVEDPFLWLLWKNGFIPPWRT